MNSAKTAIDNGLSATIILVLMRGKDNNFIIMMEYNMLGKLVIFS
jgi:hypothetical protein